MNWEVAGISIGCVGLLAGLYVYVTSLQTSKLEQKMDLHYNSQNEKLDSIGEMVANLNEGHKEHGRQIALLDKQVAVHEEKLKRL